MTRVPALASPPAARTGACFRTHADGRIALTSDWPALLREVRHAGRVAVQTRHATARLLAFSTLPGLPLTLDSSRALLSDESGSLHCCFSRWARAWGWLRECPCCASPGRVELHNPAGVEFLQLTAAPGGDALAWSALLSTLVATSPVSPATVPPAAPSAVAYTLPRLVGAQARLPFHREALAAFLEAFGDEGLPIRFTLRTAELAHRRDFVPRTVVVDDATLYAGECGASVQLAWPAVREFALTSDATGSSLHLVGEDASVLLTLSAAADPIAALTWQGALRSAFAAVT